MNFDVKETTFTVFPNPVTSHINFSEAVNGVEIYNLQGALFLRKNETLSVVTIPDNIVTGVYLLKVRLANGILVTKKIIVNK